MGRQICFFLNDVDIKDLVNYINNSEGIIVDSSLNILDGMKNDKVFIMLPKSQIFFIDYRDTKVLNQLTSEVIELSKSRRKISPDGICLFEHGRIWCEASCYDENGNKIYKSKDILDFYNKLRRYITKNYILSNNRHWYIAPNAYREYISGCFIPCSANSIIDFPQSGYGSMIDKK